MAEKHTEHIGYKYITNLLNIKEYNTNGNKKLFNSKIPDGWLLNDNNLFIIEYKSTIDKKSNGIKQLIRYAKIANDNRSNLNIYMFLGIGIDENDFEKIFMKYNPMDSSIDYTTDVKIKELFSNINHIGNYKCIHNMLVNNYKFESAKDLHDILTVIVVSILDDDFRKYYELTEDKVDKEFINDLINLVETKITDSSVSYKHILEVFKRLPFHNSFKICKTIYDNYKANPKFLGKLFQQFKKYNKYVGSNNEIWTPPVITELMYKIGLKYVDTDKHITIFDPCVGFNALLYPWIHHYDNITIKGCEMSSRLYFMGKLDLIIKGVHEPLTYCKDFMNMDSNILKSDICVCNPPYTRNISNGYDCLDFVIKSLECSKTSIFIFPKNRLTKNKQLKEEFLSKCKLLEIIELGNSVFKGVGTGDIVIIVAQKLKDKNKDIQCKYYDLKNFSTEYKSVPHVEENVLSDNGKKLLDDYVNGSIDSIEFTPSVNDITPSFNDILPINKLKDTIIKEMEKEIINLKSMSIILKKADLLFSEMYEIIENTKNCKNIPDILKMISPNLELQKVRLLDYFEQIKFKSVKINSSTIGEYPLYGASKDNEPVKFIDTYSIDTKGENWMQLNKDGSAGYCFVRNGKFSMNSHCLLFKLKDEFKETINIHENIKVISFQISNMGFCFDNAINAEKLNSIQVYMSIN